MAAKSMGKLISLLKDVEHVSEGKDCVSHCLYFKDGIVAKLKPHQRRAIKNFIGVTPSLEERSKFYFEKNGFLSRVTDPDVTSQYPDGTVYWLCPADYVTDEWAWTVIMAILSDGLDDTPKKVIKERTILG